MIWSDKNFISNERHSSFFIKQSFDFFFKQQKKTMRFDVRGELFAMNSTGDAWAGENILQVSQAWPCISIATRSP